MNLRPYQNDAIAGIQKKFREGNNSVLLVLQMGLGKTVVASRMIQMAVQNKKRVLFIAHRTFLVTQCRDKLLKFGIPCGIIKAGFKEDRSQKVQVASVQTLNNRDLPPADLIIIDEAHHSIAPQYKNIIDIYLSNGSYIVGLTATPFLRNKKIGLSSVFKAYVNTISVQDAISQGYILESKAYYAKSLLDLSKVKKSQGDFDSNELFKAFDIQDVYKNLVTQYHSKIGNRKAIIFCVNKEHCKKVTEVLNKEGYKGSYVLAETPELERIEHLKKLESGEYNFMANVDVYTEGFDLPSLEATVLCYATTSKAKYFQSAARAGRPLPEDEGKPFEFRTKKYYIILDMADNVKRFGPVEEPYQIYLNPQKPQDKLKVAPKKDCPNCGYFMPAQSRFCPECNQEMPIKKTKQEIQEEEFIELDRQRLKVAPYLNLPFNRWNEIPTELLEIFAKEKGFNQPKGWVKHQLVARGLRRKPVKILGYDFPDYFKQANILEKAYHEKTYEIDAHTWQFMGEDDKNIIHKYRLSENESIL
jgi:superfamily II DNA or RNA helicase